MEIRYHPGNDIDFVLYVKGLSADRAQLTVVDGKNMWKIMEEDGTEYILRPQSARV